jgi:glycosyltransferase involved in cell wall biosynthesis
MLKIATIVSHPIQYHAPLYRHLASTPGVDFTALFLSDFGVKPSFDSGFGATVAFDVPLIEGYASRFVPNLARRPQVDTFTGAINPALASILRRERYDAVWVHGWAQVSSWIAFATARLTHTPYLLKGDSTIHSTTPRAHIRAVKQLVLGSLIGGAAGVLCVGTENRRFYEAHGARHDQIFFAPFGVENAFFAGRADEARASGRTAALRARIGATPEDTVVLFCGKLNHEIKHPLDLVEAMRELGPRAVVAFVGDGPARRDVEEALERSGVRGRVVGFMNQSELPGWYSASDVLALPSQIEAWGLVVVSDRVGCAADLVIANETGAVHRAGDPASLAAALRPFVQDADLRHRLGAHAQRLIARYDVSKAAEGIVAAVRTIAARSGGRV